VKDREALDFLFECHYAEITLFVEILRFEWDILLCAFSAEKWDELVPKWWD